MTIKNDNLLVVGTGEGVNHVDFEAFFKSFNILNKRVGVLAFQEAYPHLIEQRNVFLNYYTWSDPYSSLEALSYPIPSTTKVLVPEFMARDYATFRMYCGTTPIGRLSGKWEEYIDLLEITPHELISSTTTKYLCQNPYSELLLRGKDYLGSEAEKRFELGKPIYGSVYFDSEQVIGTKYIWGLENKLSSYVLPIAHHLGVKNVYVCGFGMKGGRFFDKEKTRMPFNDESQSESQHEIPLMIIKKWVDDWKKFHGMNIYSIESDEWSYLNQVMPQYEF